MIEEFRKAAAELRAPDDIGDPRSPHPDWVADQLDKAAEEIERLSERVALMQAVFDKAGLSVAFIGDLTKKER